MKRDNTFEFLNCLWTNCKNCEIVQPSLDIRVETDIHSPLVSKLGISEVNSANMPSIPPLPSKISKLGVISEIEGEPEATVNATLNLKGAVLAFIAALTFGYIFRYAIWNGHNRSMIHEREELQFRTKMHLQKIQQISESMSNKNLLIQQKLANLVGSSTIPEALVEAKPSE
jgi:hypothetical protein